MASVSISCPSCSATDGVVRNGKSTAGHQRYLCYNSDAYTHQTRQQV
ncbi:IS1 family transposase, partial [Shigella sonnei]